MVVNPLHFGLLLLVLLNGSCAQQLTPQDVAGRFWTAIERGDAPAVKRYVMAADATALRSLDKILPIKKFELGRTVIERKTAFIDTTVTIDGDKPLNFPLRTYLVLENRRWKVDYERTINAVATAGKLAAVINKVHEFGAALQYGIDHSIRRLEQVLPQIEQELSRIEEQIKRQVPELRKRLENFTRELKEALENPPGNEKGVEPSGSVAI